MKHLNKWTCDCEQEFWVILPTGTRKKPVEGALDMHRAEVTCHAMQCLVRRKVLAEKVFQQLINFSKGYSV